jgi:uncharacterized membrane protein
MDDLAQRIAATGRHRIYAILLVSAIVPSLMVAWRVYTYDHSEFDFMVYNLCLAFIPFMVTQWLVFRGPTSVQMLAAGLFLWLLFFPNAPYLVTDLMHISRSQPPVPLWFDLVLLLSFAWNGLMLGFLSLLDAHRLIEVRYGKHAGWTFVGGAVLLGSLGIYIGRYLRWNSWEAFTQPHGLIADVAGRMLHPVDGPSIYGVTLVFTAFLLLGYLLLRSLIEMDASRLYPGEPRDHVPPA